MFYAKGKEKLDIAMNKENIPKMKFKFDFDGVKKDYMIKTKFIKDYLDESSWISQNIDIKKIANIIDIIKMQRCKRQNIFPWSWW